MPHKKSGHLIFMASRYSVAKFAIPKYELNAYLAIVYNMIYAM